MNFLDSIIPPVQNEETRVLELPTKTDNAAPSYVELWKSSGKFGDVQMEALHALQTCRGLIGNIGVGFGKTQIALMAPVVLGLDVGDYLLLIPASTRKALVLEAQKWENALYIPRGIVAMSYAELSNPDGYEKLQKLNPKFILADEAHYLRHPTSARTKRLRRWFKENPGCGFAAISGTLTKDSIGDFAHLAEWALREKSPLPRAYSTLDTWKKTIDPVTNPEDTPSAQDWKSMQKLVDAFGCGTELEPCAIEEKQRIVRAAFRERFATAQGVVITKTASVGASLRLAKINIGLPEIIADEFKRAETDWQRHDGEFLDGPLDKARYLNQLSCGFYYQWDWDVVGGVDLPWLYSRRAYFANVRKVIGRGFKGVETEYMVRGAMEAGRLNHIPELWESWTQWQEHAHKPAPPTIPVWLDDFVVDDVQKRVDKPTLVWVSWQALSERFAQRGFVVGDPENRDPAQTVIVSVASDQRGKNLQAWYRNLVVNPPASGMAWEQMLGRTHRQGQQAHEVQVDVYQHTPTVRKSLANAIVEARYTHEIKQQPQKILYGDWI